MDWLKDVVVDIIATLAIVLSVIVGHPVLTVIIWIYTSLLLIVKLIVLVGDDFLNIMNKANTEAPKWFSHLLYALNTGLLFYADHLYLGAGWTLIWVISFITQQQLDAKN